MSEYVIYNDGEPIEVTKEEYDVIKALEELLKNQHG